MVRHSAQYPIAIPKESNASLTTKTVSVSCEWSDDLSPLSVWCMKSKKIVTSLVNEESNRNISIVRRRYVHVRDARIT